MDRQMTLFDAIEICRRCHRLAPFTNYNGNTFAAIARTLVGQLDLELAEEKIARSLAGHIVAGVADTEETRAFRDFCGSLK